MLRYGQLENGETSKLESDYMAYLFMLDQPGAFVHQGKQFTGTIRGLSDVGELLVESNGKIRTYGFQDIQYRLDVNSH